MFKDINKISTDEINRILDTSDVYEIEKFLPSTQWLSFQNNYIRRIAQSYLKVVVEKLCS